jgi:hypothetical protein
MQSILNMVVVAFVFCIGAIFGGFMGVLPSLFIKGMDRGLTYLFVAVPLFALLGGVASLVVLHYATKRLNRG